MAGRYRFDPSLARYRDTQTGRLVPVASVRAEIDRVLVRDQARVRILAQDLRAGRLSLDQWQTQMRDTLKEIHLYNAAAARGGWAQMTDAAYGQVGAQLREQYAFLDGLTADLAGGLPVDGRFQQRAEMYVQAGRGTYHRAEGTVQQGRGMTEEQNILEPEAAHCVGPTSCPEQTARGWVPIGTLLPIGRRTCLTGCKCRKAYR